MRFFFSRTVQFEVILEHFFQYLYIFISHSDSSESFSMKTNHNEFWVTYKVNSALKFLPICRLDAGDSNLFKRV